MHTAFIADVAKTRMAIMINDAEVMVDGCLLNLDVIVRQRDTKL